MVFLGCATMAAITLTSITVFVGMVAQDFEPGRPANVELEQYLTMRKKQDEGIF